MATPRLSRAEVVALLREAEAAGAVAAERAVPTPMRVVERADPFDDTSPVAVDYGVYTEGVCGFAWVAMPGTGRLAHVARARYAHGGPGEAGRGMLRTHRGYPSGLHVWVGGYGQSMARKEAYAEAYARVLREAGYERVYADSRMD